MRTAADHAQGSARFGCLRAQLEQRAVRILLPCADSLRGEIELAQRRCENDASHRHAAYDQRDVRRELVVAFQEFLRAVERVDEEEAAGITLRLRRRFLGED